MAGEGQPRYSTEYSDEFFYKYRTPTPKTPGLFFGDDRDTLFKSVKWLQFGLLSGAGIAACMITGAEERMFASAPHKMFRYGIPYVLAGAAYGTTVGLTANVRGKSDCWNHFVAGFVSGRILGVWFKSVTIGRGCSVLFAIGGAVLKALADRDELFKDTREGSQLLNSYRIGLFTTRPPPEGIKDSS